MTKITQIIAFVIVVLAFTPVSTFGETSAIEIPKAKTVSIDGKYDTDEWKDAWTQDLKNGGSIKISHDGVFLQIGLQGGKKGLSHIYLTNGNEIFVLHSSASLGMAVYQKEGEVWQPTQKFKWELRDQSTNTEGSSTYLKTNGWLASVTATPSNEREYKVSMKFKDRENFRLAAVYVSNPMAPQFFPSTIADDTLKTQLLFGSEPSNLNFKFEQWATLKLKDFGNK